MVVKNVYPQYPDNASRQEALRQTYRKIQRTISHKQDKKKGVYQ